MDFLGALDLSSCIFLISDILELCASGKLLVLQTTHEVPVELVELTPWAPGVSSLVAMSTRFHLNELLGLLLGDLGELFDDAGRRQRR